MIFVDTSAWFALFTDGDQFHREIAKAFQEWTPRGLVTSNAILYELLGLIGKRKGQRRALPIAQAFVSGSQEAELLRVTEDHEKSALEWYDKIGSRRVSWVDCTSIAIMQDRGIVDALSADPDYGLPKNFRVWPESIFDRKKS